MARSLLIDAAGEVFLVPSIGTPPRPRESGKRTLRDIFLIAQPPLLAVMRGGEFSFLKMALTWTAVLLPRVRKKRVPLAKLLAPFRGVFSIPQR
jgi:hypothetical protein